MQDNGFPVAMPVVYQHTINNQSQLAVWEIREPLSYFLEQLEIAVPFMHPKKQLQFLASRLLLKYLEPGFPFEKVMIGTGGKPFIPDREVNFSISHCGDYAAVIISKKSDVGIDVELINPKATKLNRKFLSETERALFSNEPDQTRINRQSTLCWSIKETMFKWYGKGGVDFKKHLEITELPETDSGHVKALFKKESLIELNIHYVLIQDLYLTWTQHKFI